MCCHISNKTAYPEPVTIAAEAVEIATVPAKENDGDDGDSSSRSYSKANEKKDGDDGGSYSASDSGSLEEEKVYEWPPEETDKGDVNNNGGLQLYKLTDANKTRFTNTAIRHASSLTLTCECLQFRVTSVKTNCGS